MSNEQTQQQAKRSYDHDINIHYNIYVQFKEQSFTAEFMLVLQGRRLVKVLQATEQDRISLQYSTPRKRKFTLVWLGVQDSKPASYIAEVDANVNKIGNTVYDR